MTQRITGLETEYGCLVQPPAQLHEVLTRVRDWLFENQRYGLIDLHPRGWDEPAGNGGFLFNGGRVYIDMGHLEYSSPECLKIEDLVAYDLAGDVAEAAGSRKAFEEEFRSGRGRDRVLADINLALRLGLNGTPVFFFRGAWLSSEPELAEHYVESRLSDAGDAPPQGSGHQCLELLAAGAPASESRPST